MPAIATIRTEYMPANTAHGFIRGHGPLLQGRGFSGAVGDGHAGDCDKSDRIYASKHGARLHSRAWPTPTGVRVFWGCRSRPCRRLRQFGRNICQQTRRIASFAGMAGSYRGEGGVGLAAPGMEALVTR